MARGDKGWPLATREARGVGGRGAQVDGQLGKEAKDGRLAGRLCGGARKITIGRKRKGARRRGGSTPGARLREDSILSRGIGCATDRHNECSRILPRMLAAPPALRPTAHANIAADAADTLCVRGGRGC